MNMNPLKGIGAVLAGIVFIVVTHTVTDLVLESLGFFPAAKGGTSHYVDARDRNRLSQRLYGSRRLSHSSLSSRPANAICNDSRNNRDCVEHPGCNSNDTNGFRARLVP